MILNLQKKYLDGVQLREDIYLVQDANDLSFHGKTTFQLKDLNLVEIKFIEQLKAGLLWSEAPKIKHRLMQILNLLDTHQCLKTYLLQKHEQSAITRNLEWLSHYHLNPHEVHQSVEQTKVMIIGCGGTGGVIAEHLARSGLKNFVLLDGAKIDPPDLNRQLPFFQKDLGRQKVSVLSEYLSLICSDIQSKCVDAFLSSASQLEEYIKIYQPDIIINCADNPIGKIHDIVCSASIPSNTPVVFGGVGLEEASIGPILTSKTSKKKFSKTMMSASKKLGLGVKPLRSSIAFTNTWASVMIAFEVFKFITHKSQCHIIDESFIVDFFNFQIKSEFHSLSRAGA